MLRIYSKNVVFLVLVGILWSLGGFIVSAYAQKQELTIEELKQRPEIYLKEDAIVVKGKLRNIGSGYFENFEFVLEDENENRIHVKPWLPFEVMLPPPGKEHIKVPKVMANYVEKWIIVIGKIKINPGNIKWLKGSHYIEVQSAKEIENK